MVEKSTVLVVAISITYLTFQFAPYVELPYVNQVGEKLWDLEDQIISKINSWIENRKIQSKEKGTQEKNELSSTLEPPDVDVSISMNDKYYLGDRLTIEFTVTNNGGSCEVNYTAFETQPETGSFHLDSGESETITEAGRQVRSIGSWNASVDVSATNRSGSDQASDTTYFNVSVKFFDADSYIDTSELSGWGSVWEGIKDAVSREWSKFQGEPADELEPYVTSGSESIQTIAEKLADRHPANESLQIKELYYFVSDWITYDYSIYGNFPIGNLKGIFYQSEYPVSTLEDKRGICSNYALVLSSLYEAAGFDSGLMVVSEDGGPAHALVLLNFQQIDYDVYKGKWGILDPTAASDSPSWKFGDYQPSQYEYSIGSDGWDHYDIADVE